MEVKVAIKKKETFSQRFKIYSEVKTNLKFSFPKGIVLVIEKMWKDGG